MLNGFDTSRVIPCWPSWKISEFYVKLEFDNKRSNACFFCGGAFGVGAI
jgi:hypothetical protein